MRDKNTIRKCANGHLGGFIKINDKLFRCEGCGGVVGKELAKK